MSVNPISRLQRGTVAASVLFFGIGGGIAIDSAEAQDAFPEETINIVTHAGAGGGTDITTRMMMLQGRKVFDQDMTVVSKRGGSGAAALQYLKSTECDGYTIMTLTQSHILQIAQDKVPVEIDEIVGLARATLDPQIVLVPGDSDIATVDDLMAKSKESDGGLNWGATFVGGVDHLAIQKFSKAAGDMPYTVVPFDGGGDIITSLVGGDLDVALANYAEAEPQLKSGELKPIAALSAERLSSLPDTPTAKEQGVDAEASTVRGFVALNCVPEDRLTTLSEGIVEAMGDGVYQSYLESSSMPEESVVGSEEWTAQIRELYDESETALSELGLR